MTGPNARSSTVVLREVLWGRVRSARPLRVVEDSAQRFVGYLVPRSTVAWPRLADGAQSQTPDQGWRLCLEEWQGPGALFVVPSGAAYAAVLFFDRATGDPLRWKIDFLRPFVRRPTGFDTLDHALDLLVPLDLSAAPPKDLDDLAQLGLVGVLNPAEVASVEATRTAVEALIANRSGPFGEGWVAWRPDPGWPPVRLPPGWDDLGAATAFSGTAGPCALHSGAGARAVDGDGRLVYDLDLAGGTLIGGHAHPATVEAMQRQAALGWAFDGGHPAIAALEARMAELLPAGWSVTWAPSGEAAAELADRAGLVVADLRRNLAAGVPQPSRLGQAALFGPSLFGGLGGGAIAVAPRHFGTVPGQRAAAGEAWLPSALHAVAALETLRLIAPGPVARTTALAAQLRTVGGASVGGDGPYVSVPVDAVEALERGGVRFARDGTGLVASTATNDDIAAIVDIMTKVI